MNNAEKTFPFDDYNLLLRLGTYKHCIMVEQPNTVVYRKHESNTVHKIKFMCNGFFSLINAERKGLYPGKSARRFDRYARLGGPALEWSKKAFKNHLPLLALRILIKSWPMIAAAAIRKFFFRFKKTAPLVLIRE
jgi:hypothetical protein